MDPQRLLMTNIKELLSIKNINASIIQIKSDIHDSPSLIEKAIQTSHDLSKYANKCLYADYEQIIIVEPNTECLHKKFILGWKYMIAISDYSPADIISIDNDNNKTYCQLCGEYLGCGHIAYIAFMLYENNKVDLLAELKAKYYYHNEYNQSYCRICDQELFIYDVINKPLNMINGISDFARNNNINLNTESLINYANLILLQLNMKNFEYGADMINGCLHFTALAITFHPRFPTTQEDVPQYIITIIEVICAILGWYHLNYCHYDKHDILNISRSLDTPDAVADAIYRKINNIQFIRNIFKEDANIPIRIALHIKKINNSNSDRLSILVKNIFDLMTITTINKNLLTKQTKYKKKERGDFISFDGTRDFYLPPVKDIEIGDIGLVLSADGHIHNYIEGVCNICQVNLDELRTSYSPPDIDKYLHAIKFQEFNRHQCKNNKIHNLKGGICTRCNRPADMKLEDIISNKNLLNHFKEKVIPIGIPTRINRHPIKMIDPPTDKLYSQKHYLKKYMDNMAGPGYFDLENGEPIAICNTISNFNSAIIYRLYESGDLSDDIRAISTSITYYINKIIDNSSYIDNKLQFFAWFCYLIEVVANSTVKPQTQSLITRMLHDKSEYFFIMQHINARTAFNIKSALKDFQYESIIELDKIEDENKYNAVDESTIISPETDQSEDYISEDNTQILDEPSSDTN